MATTLKKLTITTILMKRKLNNSIMNGDKLTTKWISLIITKSICKKWSNLKWGYNINLKWELISSNNLKSEPIDPFKWSKGNQTATPGLSHPKGSHMYNISQVRAIIQEIVEFRKRADCRLIRRYNLTSNDHSISLFSILLNALQKVNMNNFSYYFYLNAFY